MDSTTLPATKIAELGDVFTVALTEAGPRLLQLDLDGVERALRVVSRRVLGTGLGHMTMMLLANSDEASGG